MSELPKEVAQWRLIGPTGLGNHPASVQGRILKQGEAIDVVALSDLPTIKAAAIAKERERWEAELRDRLKVLLERKPTWREMMSPVTRLAWENGIRSALVCLDAMKGEGGDG